MLARKPIQDISVIDLAGDIDFREMIRIKDVIGSLIEKDRTKVVLNLRSVDHINYLSIGLLLERVPRVTQGLQIRRVGQVVIEFDHVFERGPAFFKPRLEVLEDLFDLGAKIAAAHQVSVFVERNLSCDVKRAPAFYLHDMRIARRRAVDEPDVSLLFFHSLLLLCVFLLIHGSVLRPSQGKAEQAK